MRRAGLIRFRYHNEGTDCRMSLKAKLEAVIYAAEEPVTLAQLAALFTADALEWKAAQAAAAAEQAAEVAGEIPAPNESLPLLAEGLEYLGLEETPAVYAAEGAALEPGSEAAVTTEPELSEASGDRLPASENQPENQEAVPLSDAAAEDQAAAETEGESTVPVDSEAEAKRLARLRDREVKAVLKQLLDELIASYSTDGRGVEIREIAGGYRMATKPECHDAVRMFVKSLKPALKLSLPALETLAVIAYKQPVTAPEVNEIRGVESAGVLGSLLARKLIATAGRKQVIGRPILYKTTKAFLLRFGLKDVAELPSMEEFEKMAAIELEEPEPATEEAPEPAETEPAFDENAELESNSPSGEELAAATVEATEAAEVLARKEATEALENDKEPESVTDSTAVMAAEPQAALADKTPTEATPAEPDSTLQAETENSPDAQENHEKR